MREGGRVNEGMSKSMDCCSLSFLGGLPEQQPHVVARGGPLVQEGTVEPVWCASGGLVDSEAHGPVRPRANKAWARGQ